MGETDEKQDVYIVSPHKNCINFKGETVTSQWRKMADITLSQ